MIRPSFKILDFVYPIGSIYMSINSTNPSNLFGGSWEQIKGRFLLGQGQNLANTTNYWGTTNDNEVNMSVGEMGGEYNHKLSIDEMPAHNHSIPIWNAGLGNGDIGYGQDCYPKENAGVGIWSYTAIGNSGGNKTHNNMPPYLVVYIWKRIG